jgi:UDP-N-acetylglucosamine/UDP-N-acetylgalactosamine diphosphorylase
VFTFFANYSSYLFSRYAPLTLPKKVRAMFKTASSIIHSIVFVAHEIYKTFVSSYHLAEKKIPSIHGYAMGLKLEQYIFDAFSYSPSTALFEVLREEEFAPVKNANGASYDTPDSAKLMLLRLHSRWVVAAGGFLTHSVPLYMTGVEVSPLSSYAGENLEAICRGRTFHAPSEISF